MWIIKRIAQSLLTALIMVTIVFAGLQLIGSPIDTLLPDDATEADRIRLIAELGLDRPLYEQYVRYLIDVAQGDFGNSYVYNRPALTVILERLPATMELAVIAVLISLVVGIPLGMYAALRPGTISAKLITWFSILSFSAPSFWIGILFVMVFSVQLGWLPTFGRGDTRELLGIGWSFLTLNGLRHIVLPAVTLSLANTAMVLRLAQAGVKETLGREYIQFARAKGLRPSRIVGVHLLKNILLPIITVVGLDFGALIAFSIVTESLYSWPGVGKIIIDSIMVLDRPVIIAYLFLVVIMFVMINLLVDILYRVIDPRVRLAPGAN